MWITWGSKWYILVCVVKLIILVKSNFYRKGHFVFLYKCNLSGVYEVKIFLWLFSHVCKEVWCSICKTSHPCTGTAAIQMGVNCCKMGMQPGVKLGLHARLHMQHHSTTFLCQEGGFQSLFLNCCIWFASEITFSE